MRNCIIGIAGNKNSGKDTVASIINYIFHVGVTKASYRNWIVKRASIDYKYKNRVIHFADGLKDVLSIIYNIPREYFDDRKYKDELWYNIRTGKFCEQNSRDTSLDGVTITSNDLNEFFGISSSLNANPNKNVYIKLRTIMQYFGTDICRGFLADDIWIRQTMTKAVNITNNYDICVIADVRFSNESNAVMINNASLYGQVIMVNRDNCVKDDHSSETIDIKYNYTIDNNSNIMNLFYKVLEICQKISQQL